MCIVPAMTDEQALEFLADKLGSNKLVATELGVSQALLSMWKRRGISHECRPRVWAMVNDRGGNLSREWLMTRAA